MRIGRLHVASFVLATAVFAATVARGDRRADEARIVAYAKAHANEATALLERLVNVNSGTMNPEGVREFGRILAGELEATGFSTRWIDLPETKRAGHLFAEHKGNRGKRLLLIGHLDTVFEKDSPFQKFVREGNAAKGPGVADIKGGDVVMLFALKALRESGALDGASIVAAFTGDEENPGQPLEVARRDLIEAAKRSDVALEFENGLREGRTEWGTVARRSLGWWTLRTTGQMGHAQGIFGEAAGHGAVYEAARILWAFDQDLREQYLTYNAALFLAGTSVTEEGPDRGTAAGKGNVIPQKAVVHGDLRALTVEQIRKTQQKMREIVAKSLPRTSAQIEFTDVYPPMPPTAGNRALLDRLNQVNSDLGFATMDPIDPSKRGAADISFVAPYVDSLAGMGIFGSGVHSPAEAAELDTLPEQIARAAVLMYRLTRGSSGSN
ncbi:MAG: M20 family metallopeptidase [Deltaproteobacteria bacterium]|nr:MAG: M20 family metallopeptidase [Deltaproteobacteria bacterium]